MQDVSLSLIVQTAEEKVPVWYIMDEFGSRIQHSDQPSFATAPLFYMPQQIAYTVLWPLRDLETGGKCVSVKFFGFFYARNRRCAIFLRITEHFTAEQIFQDQNDCIFAVLSNLKVLCLIFLAP